ISNDASLSSSSYQIQIFVISKRDPINQFRIDGFEIRAYGSDGIYFQIFVVQYNCEVALISADLLVQNTNSDESAWKNDYWDEKFLKTEKVAITELVKKLRKSISMKNSDEIIELCK